MRPAHLTGEALVLIAHGSRDPAAVPVIRAMARAVRAARPGLPVAVSYLEHSPPRPVSALRALQAAGHQGATVVPLLLTAAYHGRVDIPGAIAAARADGLRLPVRVMDVLGPVSGRVDELLLAGLIRRLSVQGGASAGVPAPDAVVLAAAGTRDVAARATVDQVAAALGTALGVPCLAAYASAARPTIDEAIAGLRVAGAHRIAVAAYFLAPGRLYAAVAGVARTAGVVAVAAPLGDAPEIVRLILARAGGRPS